MTGGPRGGTNGRALLTIAAVAAAICTVNVLTAQSDAARYGETLPLWKPVCWEGTSAAAVLLLAFIPAACLRAAPPGATAWPRFAATHAAATVAFSAAHVLLMATFRQIIYALAGTSYRAGYAWLYEYRKDVLTYALLASVFWFWRRTAPARAAAPATFDIIDGATRLRAPLAEISAIRAAGNYVEFHLADGQTRLMRAPLADIERQLAPAGFLRTHRSWLINPARIREIAATGSGDHRVTLAAGPTVPLSRRHKAALARVTGKAGAAPPLAPG